MGQPKRQEATVGMSVDGKSLDPTDKSLATLEDLLIHRYFNDRPAIATCKSLAETGVHLGLTLNLGNYESAKIDVFVRIPCLLTGSELEAAHEAAYEWASSKVKAIAKRVKQR